ncbi:hypothetical protein [Lentzea guizhouensis]|uniref:hypothetical protein n=1 Tax=Lentzea guizhouensis TaxID=1586287 RepID=UPI0022B25E86|nr:hypothetical protein [Lentzea guizhouensis]
MGNSNRTARLCSSTGASPARTSARSAATTTPPIRRWNTSRTPEAVPWTRHRPPIDATRWKLPGRRGASSSRWARSRRAEAARSSSATPAGHQPITASRTSPAVATVISSSRHLPASHGRPDAWCSVRDPGAEVRRATASAASWSGKTTKCDSP